MSTAACSPFRICARPTLPPDAVTLEMQPARADCRYVAVDDEALRDLRGLEMAGPRRRPSTAPRANEAVKDMNAAIAAIPAYVAAEREQAAPVGPEREPQPGRGDGFASWASPASLALLEESHADLAARIRAAAQVLERYAVDPTVVEHAEACRCARAPAAGRRAMARRPPGSGAASTIARRPADRSRV